MKIGSIATDHIRRFLLHENLRQRTKGDLMLDLGCGRRPYKEVYHRHFISSVGVDVPWSAHDSSDVDIFGAADALPFKRSTFDLVLFTEVLEHVEDPLRVVKEIAGVLRKDGTLIMTVPFMVPLHEQPNDYFRFTPFSLERLLHEAGFRVREIIPMGESLLVAYTFANQIYLKLWWNISRITGIGMASSPWNPFVFMVSYLPQKVYAVLAERSIRKGRGLLFWWYKKMNYTCKGYFVIADMNGTL